MTRQNNNLCHAQFDLEVSGSVDSGHGIASGRNPKYPGGSIRPQLRIFSERGLPVDNLFCGTINLLLPGTTTFQILKPGYRFENVAWTVLRPPENFSLCDCLISYKNEWRSGYLYSPDPKTPGIGDVDNPHQMQILTSQLDGLVHGDCLNLRLESQRIALHSA